MSEENPILNNPYEEPKFHYATDEEGSLNYTDVRKGRRVFMPDIQVIPAKQSPQQHVFEINDFREHYEKNLIKKIRNAVDNWRQTYSGTTRVTRELLLYWSKNPERPAIKKLFFAQREAIETAIWKAGGLFRHLRRNLLSLNNHNLEKRAQIPE